jgi:aspartate racemase
MNHRKTIGILAGAGPFAGVDLVRKLLEQTIATKDQDYPAVISVSIPEEIADRTEFLLGQTSENPAYAMVDQIKMLEQMGASVVGIPCNTAHASEIFDVIVDGLRHTGCNLKLLHMIEEVARYIGENHPDMKKIGVLSTTGTYRTGIYKDILERKGFDVVLPTEALQDRVHDAIYNPSIGIKAQSDPVTQAAQETLLEALAYLQEQGAEAVILGCTEIPLAITERRIGPTVLIDSTKILARALVREVHPDKLRPPVETAGV